MRKISISVSNADYEAFRALARQHDRPTAELIRDAMVRYLAERPLKLQPLRTLRVFEQPRPAGELPERAEIWSEITTERS